MKYFQVFVHTVSCRGFGKLREFSLILTAPVAAGQLWDSRRGQPSEKHAVQSLSSTLSGTQAGPSQRCLFWKTNKVHFYGATD